MTEPKKQKQTKQTTRTETESEMEITRRVISRKVRGENGGKGRGNKKYKW